MTDSDVLTRDTKANQQQQSPPRPDPALKRLEPLIGTWRLEGRPVGADTDSIKGTTRFQWLDHGHEEGGTGFFLQQDMDMDYDGKAIRAHELIGFDPKTGAFSSQVFSNMAPDPWPYIWDVQGDAWTIAIRHGPMNARFHGKFSPDRNSFTGGWRPAPGADAEINAAYDVRGTRIR